MPIFLHVAIDDNVVETTEIPKMNRQLVYDVSNLLVKKFEISAAQQKTLPFTFLTGVPSRGNLLTEDQLKKSIPKNHLLHILTFKLPEYQ